MSAREPRKMMDDTESGRRRFPVVRPFDLAPEFAQASAAR